MEERSVKITDYKIIYEIEGEKYLEFFETKDRMLEQASYWKAFSDCCDIWIIEVKEGEASWHYSGWEPGMVFHWWSDKGQEWEIQRREWNH